MRADAILSCPDRFFSRVTVVLIVAVGVWAAAAGPAAAHKLRLFATVDGDSIVGSAYFGGGKYPRGVPVRAYGPDGAVLGEAVTDDKGAFRLPVAAGGGDVRLEVNAGDGHLAETVIPATALPGGGGGSASPVMATGRADGADGAVGSESTVTAACNLSEVDALLTRKLVPLEMQLQAESDSVRFRDVLGGIGYILGLTGVALWVQTRRRRAA